LYCKGLVVSAIPEDCATPAPVPVTVMGKVPIFVVLYADVSVSVAFPDVLIEAGEKVPVTPAGKPLTDRPTVPPNPSSALALML
jgi:hypothetical protein